MSTAQTPNALWHKRIREEGGAVLFGSAQDHLQRQYFDQIPLPWLEEIAKRYGIAAESAEQIRMLASGWIAQRLPVADLKANVFPAIREHNPDTLAQWSDEALLELVRTAGTDLIHYAARHEHAKRFATQPRYIPVDRNNTAEAVGKILREHYGAAGINGLIEGKRLVLLNTPDELPPSVIKQVGANRLGEVAGATLPDGTVYLVASQITPEQVPGLFLHEVGEHAALADMLGDDYARVCSQFDRLLHDGDTYATWAAMRVPAGTQPHHIPSERLAYLVERVANDEAPRDGGEGGYALGSDCLQQLRTWLFRTPTCRWLDQIGMLETFSLTKSDIAALAREAVNYHLERETGLDTGPANGWDDRLDPAKLDALMLVDPAERNRQLNTLPAAEALGYLYSLAALDAPAMSETINQWRGTLHDLAAGDERDLATLAGAILEEARRLEVRHTLREQVDDHNFAMWMEGTSTPEQASLYFASRSAKFDGHWQLTHYRADLGVVGDATYSSLDDALACARGSAYPVSNRESSGLLQQYAQVRFHAVWHGSSHRFEQFNTDAIGTGEGQTAYGWGLYFAGDQDVGAWYREQLGRYIDTIDIDGVSRPLEAVVAEHLGEGMARVIGKARKNMSIDLFNSFVTDDLIPELRGTLQLPQEQWERISARAGHLYAVELTPEPQDYLAWDKPLGEQSEAVRERLAAVLATLPEPLGADATGKTLYRALAQTLGDKYGASMRLFEQGIPGIRYLNGQYRHVEAIDGQQDAFNYVIFDANDARITARLRTVEQSPALRVGADLLVENDPELGAAERFLLSYILNEYRAGRRWGEASFEAELGSITDFMLAQGANAAEVQAHIGALRSVAADWLARGISENPVVMPTPDHILARQAFDAWHRGSVVVDDNAQPLVVYRGEHGRADQDWLNTRHASYSFGDLETATLYATQPNEYRLDGAAGAQPRIIPVYLSIKKPLIDNREGDPFIDMSVLIEALGTEKAGNIAVALDQYIYNTGNWQDNFDDQFSSVEALIAQAPERLGELYLEAYPILDNPEFVGWLKEAGFDGAIYGSSGAAHDSTEYRVFSPSQVQSAIGKRDTLIANPQNLAEQLIENAALANFLAKSCARNANGSPKVLYHTTNGDFTSFDVERSSGVAGSGIYMTDKAPGNDLYGGFVMPLYASIQNPVDFTSGDGAISDMAESFGMLRLSELGSLPERRRWAAELRLHLMAAGYDGAMVKGADDDTYYVAYSASQVKSAIGNAGTFDRNNPDIRYRLDGQRSAKGPRANGAEFGTFYHGTARPFERFDPARQGKSGGGYDHQGKAVYLTDDSKGLARFFAETAAFKTSLRDTSLTEAEADVLAESAGVVLRVQLSPEAKILDLRAPWADREVVALFDKSVGNREVGEALRQRVLSLGYDGIAFLEQNAPDGREIKGDPMTIALYNEAMANIVGHSPAAHPEPVADQGPTYPALTRILEDGFEATLGEDGEPMVVYHGTTETVSVPGEYRPGDQRAKEALNELALQYGIREGYSVPGVFERWERMGQAEKFGISPELVRAARKLLDAMKGEMSPSTEKLAFDTFRMPVGNTELGVHLGNKAAAEMFGTAFPMHIAMRRPIRLPDLGTWKPNDIVREMRKAGVPVSHDELRQVLKADDQNAAMRALIQAKGFDGVVYRNEAEGFADSYIVLDPAQIRQAAEQAPAIRYSFAGQNALTADLKSLAAAKARIVAGDDAEVVRQQTGWFAGIDGLWRFEIDDSKAHLNMAAFRTQDDKTHVARLGDVLDHPGLYAAYPSLRDVPVRTTFNPLGSRFTGEEFHLNGAYRALVEHQLSTDVFARERLSQLQAAAGETTDVEQRQRLEQRISKLAAELEAGKFDPTNPDALLSSLIHEIAHAIQDYEGFAAGGNPHMEELPTNREMAEAINRRYAEKAEAIQASPAYQALLQAALEALPPEAWLDRRGLRNEHAGLNRAAAAIYESSGLATLEDDRQATVDAFLAELDFQSLDNRFAAYRRLAGEVEARNAQARQQMSEAERLATPPSASADYPADEQIIIEQTMTVAWNGRPMPSRAVADQIATETKSAIGNNEQFNPTNPDIRYAFVGEHAQGVSLEALADARRLLDSGANAEVVRKATGWFKGVDGHWRFEIDDSNAKPLLNGLGADFWEAVHTPRGGLALLGEVLDHPALFAAYPELREIPVRASVKAGAGKSGSWNGHFISAEVSSEADLLDVLHHEAQHWVQDREGFAMGGTIRKEGVEIAARLGKAVGASEEELSAMRLEQESLRQQANAKSHLPRYKGQAAEVRELLAKSNDLGMKIEELTPRISQEDAFDGYQRLAGEVESRNVEARLRLSAEERRETPPEATADRTPEEQVVIGAAPVKSSEEGLRFVDEVTGSAYGQVDHTLAIYAGGKLVGALDYAVYEGVPRIQMITVAPAERRQGYGRELVMELQRQHPGIPIDFGMLTDEGAKLYKALPKIEVETEFKAKMEELDRLVAERDFLLEAVERFKATETPDEELRATRDRAFEVLNDLRDRIYDLEQEVDGERAYAILIDTTKAATEQLALTTDDAARFSFLGSSARLPAVQQLQEAKTRNGLWIASGETDLSNAPEQIRKETGWFIGADGHWRIELDDSQARLKPAIKSLASGGYAPAEIHYLDYAQRADGTFDVSLVPDAPQRLEDIVSLHGIPPRILRAVLPEELYAAMRNEQGVEELVGDHEHGKRIATRFQFSGLNTLMLSDVLDHPDLFRAYPHLRDVYVRVDPKLLNNAVAGEDVRTGHLVITLGIGRQLSSLIHEVQHLIQRHEGFAPGGTIARIRDEVLPGLRDEVQRLDDSITHVLRQRDGLAGLALARLTDEDKATLLRSPTLALVLEELHGGLVDDDFWETAAANLPEHVTAESLTGIEPALYLGLQQLNQQLSGLFTRQRELQERVRQIEFDGSEGTYRKLAGEVEARNVEQRLGMSAEARHATPPSRTADFPASQQIVMWDGLELGGEQLLTLRPPVRQTDTPEFKRWFGQSIVVDEDGKPQVMYHGSYRDFTIFDRMWSTRFRRTSMDTVGSWFSDNPGQGGAGMYAGGEGGVIYPVYLNIARPKVYDTFNDFLRDMHEANGDRLEDMNPPGIGSPEALRERLKAQGYDGIAFLRTENQQLHDEAEELRAAIRRATDEYRSAAREMRANGMEMTRADGAPYQAKIDRLNESLARVADELHLFGGSTEFDQQYVWIAFEPTQIKSAIGNNGDFDPANPDIRFRRVDPAEGDVLGAAQAAEQAELERAKDKGLDMSRAARLQRAQEMGFDTVTTWYHGSENAGFKSFNVDGGRAETKGTGAFFSNRRSVARTYSGSNDDAPVYTGTELFNDPGLVNDLEIEKVWAIVDAQGEIVPASWDVRTIYPAASYDTPEQVLEESELELDPGESIVERFTVHHRGYEEVVAGTAEECIAYLDEADFGSPGIYSVYLRVKEVREIDWEGRNWDDGPKEICWRIEDADGNPVDWLYSEEAVAGYLAANPGHVAHQIAHSIYFSTNDAAREARDQGYDAVLIKNVEDNGSHRYGSETGDVMVVFDASNIRSIYAAFDPAQSASSDIRLRTADPVPSASQTDTAEFKEWFGRSRVVDLAGMPLAVYQGSTFQGAGDSGTVFSDDPVIASTYATNREGANDTPPAYLSLQNPLVIDARGCSWDQIDDSALILLGEGDEDALFDHVGIPDGERVSADYIARIARRSGKFDGVIIQGVRDPNSSAILRREATVYVAFEPSQIQPEVRNSGRPDVRQRQADPTPDFEVPAGDPLESEAFRNWYGRSVLADGEGKPLVLYHGTTADFSVFNAGEGMLGRGIYLTPNASAAPVYPKMQNMKAAREGREAMPVSIMPVYGAVENPLVLHELPVGKIDAAAVEAQGHDGIILLNKDGSIKELTAFHPEQVKSAIGNNGAFDRANPDIRFSRVERNLTDRFDPADAGALIMDQAPQAKLHTVFHGSPHTFEQFKLERIGSGEGQQAFGWGLYFADLRGVANYYKGKDSQQVRPHNLYEGKRLTRGDIDALCHAEPFERRRFFLDNQKALLRGENALDLLRASVASVEMQIERDKRQAERAERGESTPFPAVVYRSSAVAHQQQLQWLLTSFGAFEHVPGQVKSSGNLYQVELLADPEHYLHWDMPLAAQSASVRAALSGMGIDGAYVLTVNGEDGEIRHAFHSRAEAEQALQGHQRQGIPAALSEDDSRPFRGKEIYRVISTRMGGDRAASEALREAGLPGLRFFDGPSRKTQSGTCNYVLFDDSQAVMSARNEVPVMTAQVATSGRITSISDIPGVALHGDFERIRERLSKVVAGLSVRAEAHTDELKDRLSWLKGYKSVPRKLVTQTQSALAEAKVRQRAVQKWKVPTTNTVLEWDAPLSPRQRARLAKLGDDFSGMTGHQVLLALVSAKGSAAAATAALASVGVTGIREDQRLVLWDAPTQQLATELSKVHDLTQFHLAYHGSRHTFDEFRSDQIGTGEGAQAYGYGLYFTSGKLIARDYQTAHLHGMVWYEGELFSNLKSLRETVVPRLLALNPELAKVNYGELEWHLNKMVSAPDHDRSYTESLIDGTPEAFRTLARHLAEGVRKADPEQINGAFLIPAGGARTLNAIAANPAHNNALHTIRSSLHWRVTPTMSPAQLQEALQETVRLVSNIEPWRESLAEIMEQLERQPNDTYLRSRMRDCNWYIREAEEVATLLQEYPLDEWQVCAPIGQGMLYMVELDIAKTEYLDHQAPFDQQSTIVQDALSRLAKAAEVPEEASQRLSVGILQNAPGYELYAALALRQPGTPHLTAPVEQEKVAAALLLTEGVQGIRYPDGLMAGGSTGKTNYVVFDEARISIIGQTDKAIRSEDEEIPAFDFCDIEALEDAQIQKRQQSLSRLGC